MPTDYWHPFSWSSPRPCSVAVKSPPATVGKKFAAPPPTSARAKKSVTHRAFKDLQGRIWDVWQVHPSAAERRFSQRRVFDEDRTDSSERRSGEDRRLSGRDTRAPVAAEFAYGWLCFETLGEKRRLAPVPEGWDRADDENIEQWCAMAKPAVRRKTGEIKGEERGKTAR